MSRAVPARESAARRRRLVVAACLAVATSAASLGVVKAIGATTDRSAEAAAAPARAAGRESPDTAAAPRAHRSVTIAWGGDTVLGSVYGLPPAKGKPLLAHVAGLFRAADVGFLNLEEALSDGAPGKCGPGSSNCFAFGAPTSFASALPASGIRIVNLANNHTADYGPAGEASTLEALRRAHVAWTGRPGQIEVLRIRGLRIAFLGFAPYPWAARLDRIPEAVALVRRAAAKADLVVVAIHAGAEGSTATHVPRATEYFLGENRGDSRAFARAVVGAGADLVVGSGPHVVRGVQWYRNRLVAYSLGNLAGWHTFGLGGALSASAALSVTLRDDGRVVRAHWTPLLLEGPGIPVPDPGKTSLRLVSEVSRDDFGTAAARFTAAGDLVVP